MKRTQISIIVPVYNVEQYIGECFASIVAQTYEGELECIFVNDCGQDSSMSILEELVNSYHGPISMQVLHHEHNRGLSAARNTGINYATGDYLYFLDSDDTITPDCISRLTALAGKYPGVDMVQGSTRSSLHFLSLKGRDLPEYSANRKWVKKLMMHRCAMPMTAWNKLVRREWVLEHGIYFEEGIIHEDDVWLFFLSKYIRSIAFCFEETYNYRDNPNGIMAKERAERTFRVNIAEIISRHIGAPYASMELLYLSSLTSEQHPLDDYVANVGCGKKTALWLIKIEHRAAQSRPYSISGLYNRLLFRILSFYVDVECARNQGNA